MIHILWQATQVVFWLTLFAVIAAGPWLLAYMWYDESYSGNNVFSTIAVGLGVLWFAISSIGGIIWIINEIDKADQAAHSWRGGSGPDTHCEFDIREEMVGKVMQKVTYTVCD